MVSAGLPYVLFVDSVSLILARRPVLRAYIGGRSPVRRHRNAIHTTFVRTTTLSRLYDTVQLEPTVLLPDRFSTVTYRSICRTRSYKCNGRRCAATVPDSMHRTARTLHLIPSDALGSFALC